MIEEFAHECEVVERDRDIDIRMLVWTLAVGFAAVALAALHSGGDVHLVDLDRPDEIDGWSVERTGEALDAGPWGSVRHIEFCPNLPDTRVESQEHVKSEQQIPEDDLRVGEDWLPNLFTNYERGDNRGSTIITVSDRFYNALASLIKNLSGRK